MIKKPSVLFNYISYLADRYPDRFLSRAIVLSCVGGEWVPKVSKLINSKWKSHKAGVFALLVEKSAHGVVTIRCGAGELAQLLELLMLLQRPQFCPQSPV